MSYNQISERAKRVQQEAIVIDMLQGSSDMAMTWPKDELAYFKEAVDAGITAIHFTVPETSAIPELTDDFAAAVKQIVYLRKAVSGSEYVKIAYTTDDIESAKKEGKVALILQLQDAIPYERDLALIEFFHDLGVTVMEPAYYQQTYLCAGCGESVDHGLTDQGRKAIKEMNRLGILIDVSHVGDRSAMEIINLSAAPIAITHSTTSTLVELQRAKSDEVIKAACKKGGIIGHLMLSMFNERRDRMGLRPTLDDFVEIMDYLVELVGVDHVGLGTDTNPFETKGPSDRWYSLEEYGSMYLPHIPPPYEERYCKGWNSITDIIKVTEALLKHGYSDDNVKKLLGGNFLRLLKDVWSLKV